MSIDNHFINGQRLTYDPVSTSEKDLYPKIVTQQLWPSHPPRSRPTAPYVKAEDLNGWQNSYMVVSNGKTDFKPLAQSTKSVVKWTRAILLVLRICSWIGAAGLLACIICIKPTGYTMDWVIRVPPAAALIHLTYAIYHLSRSANSRTASSSGSYMIFAAIFDACLIPFQVLIAIIARNQLPNDPGNGPSSWQTILASGYQRHTIVYSTFLIGIVTAGLHLLSICACIFLATRFYEIAKLPPDMNPLEDNLTGRGHKKAKSSMSSSTTENSTTAAIKPLLANSTYAASFEKVYRSSDSMSPNNIHKSDRPNSRPDAQRANRLWRYEPRSQETLLSQERPVVHRATQPRSIISNEDDENWSAHPPTPPDSPPHVPAEFQHLRDGNHKVKDRRPAPLSSKSKYDFSNRSPRPLGLHPPTPREATPNDTRAFNVRILKNIDGNSSAPRTSSSLWQDIKLETESPSSQAGSGSKKRYGEVVNVGQVPRNQARVVSSSTDSKSDVNGVRLRQVSGKVAEEGRGGIIYTDF